MAANAPVSPPARAPSLGICAILEAAALTLLMGLSVIDFAAAPGTDLDASWQEMLVYAHGHGLQFGRDLIFTWGPWGYLLTRHNLGAACEPSILAWEAAAGFLVAGALVALTRGLSAWRRLAFAAFFVAVAWIFPDTPYVVLITLVGAVALVRPNASLGGLAAWALVPGILATLKFTFLLLGSSAVLLSMVCWIARGSARKAAAVGLSYALAAAAAWAAAGQSLDNLYPYVARSLEIAAGYGGAMGLDETWPVFLCGAAVALACLVLLLAGWRANRDRPHARYAVVLLGVSMFMMWREGFTRADGHVMGFFGYVLIMAPAAVGLLAPGRRWHWFDASALACLAGMAAANASFLEWGPKMAWARVPWNVRQLARIDSMGQEWRRQFEDASRSASLPAIRKAVGAASVDVYDFNTGAALLNGLNLSARPIFQSYSAYTPSLEGWNLRYYQSARAPQFLMWCDEAIDQRYPGQNDAMLLAALPGHYWPVLKEGAFWLFERRVPLAPRPVERRLAFERTVYLSEPVTLPAERDQAIWLRADPAPSALGRARSIAYRPARIDIVTTDDGGIERHWRLVPAVARAGFILAPTLEGGDDMAALMQGKARNWLRSFRFEAPAGQGRYWTRIDIGVYRMPGIPVRAAATGAGAAGAPDGPR